MFKCVIQQIQDQNILILFFVDFLGLTCFCEEVSKHLSFAKLMMVGFQV